MPTPMAMIIVSGPLPMYQRGHERWIDTIAAAGGTKRLPNSCAGVAVERLKFEEASGAETS